MELLVATESAALALGPSRTRLGLHSDPSSVNSVDGENDPLGFLFQYTERFPLTPAHSAVQRRRQLRSRWKRSQTRIREIGESLCRASQSIQD